VDTSDDKEIALTFLRAHSVTFLNVVDNSSEAQTLIGQKYRCSGVPLNYILDREGKIAAAWYGIGIESRAVKALNKLGLSISGRIEGGRGYLGVQINGSEKGVLVNGLEPGGPAEKAGVRTGDVIRSVGATPTPDVKSLVAVIGAIKPGEVVVLNVLREGSEIKISVTIGAL
jgi:S1-C subfamily serine protease